MPLDWLKKIVYFVYLCCLHHNKADVQNISIHPTLYLNFVHIKVISNVNSRFLLYVIEEN